MATKRHAPNDHIINREKREIRASRCIVVHRDSPLERFGKDEVECSICSGGTVISRKHADLR
jgi:hypothetical protein